MFGFVAWITIIQSLFEVYCEPCAARKTKCSIDESQHEVKHSVENQSDKAVDGYYNSERISQTKRNKLGSTPSLFTNNLIFNFCLNFRGTSKGIGFLSLECSMWTFQQEGRSTVHVPLYRHRPFLLPFRRS